MTSPLSTFANGVSPERFKYSRVETTKRTPQIIFSNRPYCALAVTRSPRQPLRRTLLAKEKQDTLSGSAAAGLVPR
jgi:hypothetical protein